MNIQPECVLLSAVVHLLDMGIKQSLLEAVDDFRVHHLDFCLRDFSCSTCNHIYYVYTLHYM